MQYRQSNNIPATSAAGVVVPLADDGTVTLVNGTTYYAGFGGQSSPLESLHFIWDAALIVTITFEDCNFDDFTINDVVAGHWVQENPSTAYIGVVGAGATVANMTITVAGGAVGGAMVHLGNYGGKRGRAKLVVGGTGGKLRIGPHGKA